MCNYCNGQIVRSSISVRLPLWDEISSAKYPGARDFASTRCGLGVKRVIAASAHVMRMRRILIARDVSWENVMNR